MRSLEELEELREGIQERYNIKLPDVVMEPVWFGRRPSNKIEGKFAVVDNNTGNVFAVASDLYMPIPYEQTISDVEKAILEHPEFGTPTIKLSLLAEGGKLNMNVKFEEVEYTINNGDKFNPTIDIKSSLDLGWKFSTLFGAYRLICSNGLTVGEVFESFKKRHLTSLNPQILGNTLADGMVKFEDQAIMWKGWSQRLMSDAMYEDLWESAKGFISTPEREKIEQTRSEGDGILLLEHKNKNDLTIWDVFQSVTSYANHSIKSELRQLEIMPKITNVFEKVAKKFDQ